MHLNVMEDVEQGIAMMKFAVNHPYMFLPIREAATNPKDTERKRFPKAEENELKGMRRRVAMAFLLGFCQAVIAIIVESFIIYYFSCLTSFIKIVT